MGSKSWFSHEVTFLLLYLACREIMQCDGFTVDPPKDIVISDPGHLGYLDITWTPPAGLVDIAECQISYQVDYFDTYRNSWSAVRTPRKKYSAQFDLMKDIRVRVSTLLSGPCTNGTTVKSTNYTEVVQQPLGTGITDTAIQNFICVYHNMNYMECKWEQGPKMLANAQQKLYFWYKELEKAEECPKYLISNGYRSGCNFTGIFLPDFTNIIFCVNGSSPEGPLKSTYTTLQIQNHVKPETTETLHLQAGPDKKLELRWDRPVGRIPRHCLEWEVEHSKEGPDGKIALEKTLTRQMNFTLPSMHNMRSCFRVRSRLYKYCADSGIWSQWSHQTCNTAMTAAEPEWDVVPVYVCIAVAIIAALVLSLCVGAALRVRRSRREKRTESLLASLFGRNSIS